MNSPIRGEIWWADLEPTRGQEIDEGEALTGGMISCIAKVYAR